MIISTADFSSHLSTLVLYYCYDERTRDVEFFGVSDETNSTSAQFNDRHHSTNCGTLSTRYLRAERAVFTAVFNGCTITLLHEPQSTDNDWHSLLRILPIVSHLVDIVQRVATTMKSNPASSNDSRISLPCLEAESAGFYPRN